MRHRLHVLTLALCAALAMAHDATAATRGERASKLFASAQHASSAASTSSVSWRSVRCRRGAPRSHPPDIAVALGRSISSSTS